MKVLDFRLPLTVTLLTTAHLAVAQQWTFSLFQSPVVDPEPISIVSADVNGDGWPDLISASFNDSTLTVLTNNGHWGFSSNAVYLIDPNGFSGLQFVTSADVNGDGHPDLIAAMYGGMFSVEVLTNDGTGNFGVNATYGDNEEINCVIAADVNGDGKPDLIYVNAWNRSVNVLTNDGTGLFALSGTNTVGATPIALAAVDVNGDHALDLVVVNYNSDSLTVLTNNGKGIFGLSATLPVGAGPYWVTATDINRDGWPDLISADYNGGTMTVWTNNGSGGFGSNATIVADSGVFYVAPVDFNGTGTTSLVAAVDLGYNNPGEMEIFTNDDSGNFTVTDKLRTGFSPCSIVTADLNKDGRPDLVSADYNNPTPQLSVYFNVPLPSISQTPTNSASVFWPSLSTGWQLQQNPDLKTTNWLDTSFLISDDGTNKSINAPLNGNLFFRLEHRS